MHAHIGALGIDIRAHTGLVTKTIGHRVFHPQGGEVQAFQGTVLGGDFDPKALLSGEPHFPGHGAGGVVNIFLVGIGLVRQLNQHPHA